MCFFAKYVQVQSENVQFFSFFVIKVALRNLDTSRTLTDNWGKLQKDGKIELQAM